MFNLDHEILNHVKNCGGDACSCAIEVDGIEGEDVLWAAHLLVKTGRLVGAFPRNPNFRDGFQWGWLALPRS